MERVYQARARVPGSGRRAQHRHAVSDRGRSRERAWSREGRSTVRRRQRGLVLRCDAARRSNEDVDLAGALPAWIFLSPRIRTNRRPECWLEGARVLVELLDVHALAPGRRQGFTTKDCEVPGAAESSGEIGLA